MTTDDKIKDERLQYDMKQQIYQLYHLEKLISMNILQVKNYYHLIKVE